MKIALIIIGALAVLLGSACMAGGSFVLVALDSDGFLSSGDAVLASDSFALVSENAEFEEAPDAGSVFDDWGEVTLRITASPTEGQPNVFIGVGPARDIETYLEGVAWDEVDDIDFNPLRVDLDRVPGEAAPAPPGDQPFWHATASGSGEQVLEWEIETGDYRFVIMNADGSPNISVTGEFAVKAPAAQPISIVLIILGALAFILGIVAIVMAARALSKEQPPAAPPPTVAPVAAAPVAPPPASPPPPDPGAVPPTGAADAGARPAQPPPAATDQRPPDST